MRLIYNQLSGRLKPAASVLYKTLALNFHSQSCVYRYVSVAPAILKKTFHNSTVLPRLCLKTSAANTSPYHQSVRWYTQTKPTEISHEDLRELIDEDGIIIDVRTEKEVTGSGLIPHAKNIPLEGLKEALSCDAEQFERLYKVTKPNKKEGKLVFYAQGPVKSSTAVELAQKLGYKKARHYPGGWKEWSEKRVHASKA